MPVVRKSPLSIIQGEVGNFTVRRDNIKVSVMAIIPAPVLLISFLRSPTFNESDCAFKDKIGGRSYQHKGIRRMVGRAGPGGGGSGWEGGVGGGVLWSGAATVGEVVVLVRRSRPRGWMALRACFIGPPAVTVVGASVKFLVFPSLNVTTVRILCCLSLPPTLPLTRNNFKVFNLAQVSLSG